MTRHRTEYKGLVVRRRPLQDKRFNDQTKEWRNLMRHVGRCIKSGGYVVLTTYVERKRRASDASSDIVERCDATLTWGDD